MEDSSVNTLPPANCVHEFRDRVLCLCALFDCSETSGARTDKRNAQVGGKPGSRHRVAAGGMATDLVPDDNTPATRVRLCLAARRLGLFPLDEGDHVHVQGVRPVTAATLT